MKEIDKIKLVLECLEEKTPLKGKKTIKEAIERNFTFSTSPNDGCDFYIHGLETIYTDFQKIDINTDDLFGVLYWKLNVDYSEHGVRGIDFAGKISEVIFDLILNDEEKGQQTIDTSDYEIDFSELQFQGNFNTLYITDVYIDVKNKTITCS